MNEILPGFIIYAIVIGAIMLAGMWILIPIEIFGIRNRLDKLINIEEAMLKIETTKYNGNKD
jgi:hypothetical protein